MHDAPQPHHSTAQPPSTETRGSRRVAYVLGGCGCLALSIILFLVVAFVGLSWLSEAKDSNDSEVPEGVTIKAPSEQRQAKAQEVAETYLDHIAAERFDAAWEMTSDEFQETSGKPGFRQFASTVREIATEKPRHLFEAGKDTLSVAGQRVGVQTMMFEYRREKERRTYRCEISLRDSQLLDQDAPGDQEDFQIMGSHCVYAYIRYRKGWGGDIPEQLADSADSLTHLINDGFPPYEAPPLDKQRARATAQEFQRRLERGRYQQAHQMLFPELRELLSHSKFKKISRDAKRRGFGSAKLEVTGRDLSATEKTWLNDGVGAEQYSIDVELPKAKGDQATVKLSVIRYIDYNKPPDKRPDDFFIGIFMVNTR
jgi:hypothetical protein